MPNNHAAIGIEMIKRARQLIELLGKDVFGGKIVQAQHLIANYQDEYDVSRHSAMIRLADACGETVVINVLILASIENIDWIEIVESTP